MNESFAELFAESNIESKMRLGSIVSAIVIDIKRDTVIVNAGLKSEGFIPVEQFFDDDGQLQVNIGDEVDVALDLVEDGFGETKLSRDKAKRLLAWQDLEKAHEDGEIVTGIIAERVKGGFTVNINKVKAFLPGSLVDVRPLKDIHHLENKSLEFKVIKIDQIRNNVVVSRRAVLGSETAAERTALLNSLEENAIVRGVVKNTTDYGAFIDLGGVDGLLHITDMAWKRVKNPSDIVSVGEEIDLKVLKFDREFGRVSLGLKQMSADPWGDLAVRYPKGSRLNCRVCNIADYGCFVELEDGIEGLVHISEMDWTKKNIHPSKLVKIGDMVDIVVLEVDSNKRRISISMKRCQVNPWEEFSKQHKKGNTVSGVIKSITDFGIFVGFEGDIDGLVHLSDISWSERGEVAIRKYNRGNSIEAILLVVDVKRERISLGIKQLQEDTFTAYIAENPKGSIVKGTVKDVDTKGVVVALAEGVEGYMHAREIVSDKEVNDARAELNVADELEMQITAIDRKKRSITVSVSAKEKADETAAVKEYGVTEAKQPKSSIFGDLLKKHLNKGTEE